MSITRPIEFSEDFLGQQGAAFETGATKLKEILDKALDDLKSDPSDPGLLAAYQSSFSSYTVFRNVQTNTIKGFKDIDMSTIQASR